MAEDFGLLYSTFFTGPTGRELQAAGRDAVILGAYVSCTRHGNLIGLYQLPLAYITADLPVLGGTPAILAAFDALEDVGFAFRDEASEVIWVAEMARIRLGLAHGAKLKTSDKRHNYLVRLYRNVTENPYLDPFFDRYEVQLTLGDRRVAKVPQATIRGPSEGHARGLGGGTSEIDTRSRSRSRVQAATAQAHPHKDPNPRTPDQNVEVITALVSRELLILGLTDGDLVETTKRHCAIHGIAYNSFVVRKAIESATVRRRFQES